MKSAWIVCLAFGVAVVSCAQIRDDPVLVRESKIDKVGNFHSLVQYASGNKVQQDGHLKTIGSDKTTEYIEGLFLFEGDDGKSYQLSYIADENGFQPHGDHLPTSPPIPEAIQRALDYVSKHSNISPEKPVSKKV